MRDGKLNARKSSLLPPNPIHFNAGGLTRENSDQYERTGEDYKSLISAKLSGRRIMRQIL